MVILLVFYLELANANDLWYTESNDTNTGGINLKLIVCLDDRGGMAFNRRRQSRDRILIENLVQHVGTARLYVTPYTAKLFRGHVLDLWETDTPLLDAGSTDYCFSELEAPSHEADVSELTVYRWNRHYPSDTVFSLNLSDFTLASTTEFVGSSHEKITKEVWKK